jgi:hypothetical protein
MPASSWSAGDAGGRVWAISHCAATRGYPVATGSGGPVGRVVLVRSEPQYQHGKRQNQNGSCCDQQILSRPVFHAPNLDEDAPQRCHRDIDQITNGKSYGLEIDSVHGADFKIDEQEKNVRKFGLPLAQHAEESGERGPEGRGADCEERQIVELIKAFCDSGICGA